MEVPRHWRLKDQRYRLIGDIWPNGEVSFPPKLIRPSLQETPDAKVLEKDDIPDYSTQATYFNYDGALESYAAREVRPYSKMLLPEVDQEEKVFPNTQQTDINHASIRIEVERGIVYQDTKIEV
jgi:hypothetical protein